MSLAFWVVPLWVAMFSALGAAPVSIPLNEAYSALQTKIADGQENPLALISTAKLYEVQKYCSLTNHMWDGFWFLANRRAWEKIPEDVRTIVARNINAAAVKERGDTAKLNANLRGELRPTVLRDVASALVERMRRENATIISIVQHRRGASAGGPIAEGYKGRAGM